MLILFALHDSSYAYLQRCKWRFSSLPDSYHLRRDMVANSFGHARGSGAVRRGSDKAANLNRNFLFLEHLVDTVVKHF